MPVAGLRRERARRRVLVPGAAACVALFGLCATIVLSAADRPGFLVPPARPGFYPAWMAGPLAHLTDPIAGQGAGARWTVTGVIVAMSLLYLLLCTLAPRLPRRLLWGTVIALQLLLLLSPPLSYTDVFNYVDYARMGALHGLNPYVVLPFLGPHADPAYAISNWHGLLSPYGPLFTAITYALVPLGVPAMFWTLKALIGAAGLAIVALTAAAAPQRERAIAIVGLNPLVLVWGLGGDHNDFLMVLPMVLAITWLTTRRASSGIALAVAAAIKLPAVILAPAFAVTHRRWAGGFVVGAVAMVALSIAVFGVHAGGITTQTSLVAPVSPANLLGLALGLGGESRGLRIALDALVVTVALTTAVRWRDRPLLAGAAAMLALTVTLPQPQPWYVLWLLPFAALLRARWLRGALIVLGAYFILFFGPTENLVLNALDLHPDRTALGVRNARHGDRLLDGGALPSERVLPRHRQAAPGAGRAAPSPARPAGRLPDARRR